MGKVKEEKKEDPIPNLKFDTLESLKGNGLTALWAWYRVAIYWRSREKNDKMRKVIEGIFNNAHIRFLSRLASMFPDATLTAVLKKNPDDPSTLADFKFVEFEFSQKERGADTWVDGNILHLAGCSYYGIEYEPKKQ